MRTDEFASSIGLYLRARLGDFILPGLLENLRSVWVGAAFVASPVFFNPRIKRVAKLLAHMSYSVRATDLGLAG
jgi:hypothetical protein